MVREFFVGDGRAEPAWEASFIVTELSKLLLFSFMTQKLYVY